MPQPTGQPEVLHLDLPVTSADLPTADERRPLLRDGVPGMAGGRIAWLDTRAPAERAARALRGVEGRCKTPSMKTAPPFQDRTTVPAPRLAGHPADAGRRVCVARAGGGGRLAVRGGAQVAKSAPDGQTLFIDTAGHAVNPSLCLVPDPTTIAESGAPGYDRSWRFVQLGADPGAGSRDQVAAFLQEEVRRYAGVVKAAGMKVD